MDTNAARSLVDSMGAMMTQLSPEDNAQWQDLMSRYLALSGEMTMFMLDHCGSSLFLDAMRSTDVLIGSRDGSTGDAIRATIDDLTNTSEPARTSALRSAMGGLWPATTPTQEISPQPTSHQSGDGGLDVAGTLAQALGLEPVDLSGVLGPGS